MKKIILPLIVLILFCTTGCSYKSINNSTVEELINNLFEEKKPKENISFGGYKIYLPNNMVLINDEKGNNVLYSEGEKYYLYVDLVSYYNKKNNDYQINDKQEAIFSKILDTDNKKGYVLVTKQDDDYFVEVMYNYSKIEVVANDYKQAVLKSLIVLRSVNYNDKIIDTLVGNNTIDYNEEEYNLLGPSKQTSDFLEWKEMYGNYKDTDHELPDEDTIDINKAE